MRRVLPSLTGTQNQEHGDALTLSLRRTCPSLPGPLERRRLEGCFVSAGQRFLGYMIKRKKWCSAKQKMAGLLFKTGMKCAYMTRVMPNATFCCGGLRG